MSPSGQSAATGASLSSLLRREGRAIVAAVLYFSRCPVPWAPLMTDDDWRRAMSWWPLVGVGVGLTAAGLWWLASAVLGFPSAVAAGVAVAAGILATGALQQDAFADVCDGFGGGKTRADVLAIMRDSRVGAYGVVGLVLLIGFQWQTLAALPSSAVPVVLVAAHAASRFWGASVLAVLVYARPEKSRGAYVSSRLRGGRLAIPVLLGVLPLLLLLPWQMAAACLVMGSLVWGGCMAWFRRRLGGYTGDCLGSTQQLTELTVYLTALSLA